jgi:hypothetical protein
MIVSDRVMDGDVNAVYNPNLAQIDNRSSSQDRQFSLTDRSGFNLRDDEHDDFFPLTKREEHVRLQNAIKSVI